MATTSTKPQLPALKTPISATYPSEIRSPMVMGTPVHIKKEEDAMKTPITPPSAYLDFLKALSPAPGLMSPLSTGASFKFGDKPPTPSVTSVPADKPTFSTTTSSSATPQPPNTGRSTTSLSQSVSSASSVPSTPATTPGEQEKPPRPSPRVIIPPSPFVRSHSERTPHRLHIPQSPFSPARPSPRSAHSMPSLHTPWSPYSAAASPRDWNPERKPTSGPRAVTVKQVVTRTVTYSRTPLDPAPKGKRRKIE